MKEKNGSTHSNGSKMKKILFALLAAALFTGIAAEVKQSDGKIILSNARMTVEISLTQGGRISKLTDLRSKSELTEVNQLPGGSGLFGDTLFNPVNNKITADFREQTYRVVSIRKTPEIRVELVSPDGNPLTIRKTYVMNDTGTLKVEYELTNPGTRELVGMFRNNFGFRFTGDRKYTVQFPEGKQGNRWTEPVTVPGKNRLVYDTDAGKTNDLFFFRLQRDYLAVTGSKTGAVVNMPFPVLGFCYTYQSSRQDGMAITDWFTTPFALPPLSKGMADAELLAVMDDPLAKYKYRFTVSLTLVSPKEFVYEKYREPSKEAKRTDFLPVSKLDLMYSQFNTPALICDPKPERRLRIVAVAAAHGNYEMGELNRRINQDLSVLDTSNTIRFAATPYFGWNIPEPEKMMDVLLKQNPEIILFCGHHEESLPKHLQEKIVKLVEGGAAFIFVSEKNAFPSLIPKIGGKEVDPAVYAGILRDKLPAFGKIIEYRRGKGRVIHVRFPMMPHRTEWVREGRSVVPYVNPPPEDFPYWEYYFAFYDKLFRYAAGRPSGSRIVRVEAGQGKARLELTSRDAVPGATIRLTADTPEGRHDCGVVWQGNLPAGRQTLELTLPPALDRLDGEHRLHFLLSSPKASLDWYAAAFRRQAEAGLTSLRFDRKIFRKNEAVSGKIGVRGGGQLVLRLREGASGRTVALLKQNVKNGEMPFALKRTVSSSESAYRLEAELLRDGKRISVLRRSVFLEPWDQPANRIRPLIWGPHVATWRDRLFFREMADGGFDVYLAPMAYTKDLNEVVAESVAAQEAGMEYVPLGLEHVRANGKDTIVRTPCLRDPAYRDRVMAKTGRIAEKMRESFAKKCLISDEMTLSTYFNTPHDFCMSQWCLAAFRKMLQQKYQGDLAALNRNWGTSFGSWDQVKPLTFRQSNAKKNFVSFIEHRTFMFTNMTDLFRMITAKIAAEAGGTTGVSGMQLTKLYQGFDQIESLSYMRSSAYYHTPFALDAIRSFSTKDHLTGSFTDYGLRYGIWEQLIGGLKMPSVWWYGHLIRRGDGRLSKEGEHLKRMFDNIRDSGADEILGGGRRVRSGIAVLWSTPSLVAAGASVYPSPVNADRYRGSVDSWSQLIRDMGLDSPDVVTPEQLVKLTPKEYPVLILPLAQLLSDSQVEALKNYVRNGGLLIADYAPGLLDQFGVVRRENPLNEVFGVTIKPAEKPGSGILQVNGKTVNGILPGEPLALQPQAKTLASLRVEVKGTRLGGIRLNTTSRAVAPAAVLHSYGKGKAMYLNFLLPDYFAAASATTGSMAKEVTGPMIRGMRDLFRAAGVDLSRAHDLPAGSNYAEYVYDGVRYLFLSRRKNNAGGRYSLRLNGSYYVYETLTGKSLGKLDRIEGTIEPQGVRMFALLRQPVSKKLTANIRQTGRLFTVDCGSSQPGVLFRIRVSHNGRELRRLSRTVGSGTPVSIDPGLETVGRWRIEVIRIADRQMISKSVVICP